MITLNDLFNIAIIKLKRSVLLVVTLGHASLLQSSWTNQEEDFPICLGISKETLLAGKLG